ncbi:GAF domain-containing sensor histidine kinase [Bdellovibrio sp. KM01]|uniref:GAF domain-containing sensor histidine kinase n=1 Tax=Bdellovibrio sp. KM01 TaxID=2748865 RepID=UPI0015EADA9A|nr:GAF domain-containing sensor histidine kinase [Bdellovibrio sp. KM01]QLY26401.1 GAF domain-containing sensor histidine kinase [Bdellovibrio sp. KM01]
MEPLAVDGMNGANILLGKIVQEINTKMGSGCAFDQILESIFDALIILIPFDRIGIALVDADTKSIRLEWVKSRVDVNAVKRGYSANLEGSSLKRIIETGEPRIINDLREYAAVHTQSVSTKLILKDGMLSNLTCPLRSDNKAIGVVFFSSRDPNTYRDAHIQVFKSIADELSVVVEQAKLKNYFTEIRKRDLALSKIIHDIRSPVSVIEGYLELASEEGWYDSLPTKFKDICSILKRNTNSILSLLDELRDYSLVSIPKGPLTPLNLTEVAVNDFCIDISAVGKILSATKDISFETDLSEGLPLVITIDRNRMQRVLENLITNSIKFSKRDTKITFSVWSHDDRIYFSVADQGLGIRTDELPKLFTDFGKTSTLPSEGEKSSGLGLAIVKNIIEQHRGQISVESTVGRGSTFTFWLPLGGP